jgi:hypothetical protein
MQRTSNLYADWSNNLSPKLVSKGAQDEPPYYLRPCRFHAAGLQRDTANNLLLRTNEQIAIMSKQMVDTQALLVESNRLVVESTHQLEASIKNVVQSNGKMDISNANMTKSNANMELTNENMTKTLAGMAESNKNVARSNALMTEMNDKLGVMTKVIEKIPGLKP